MTPEDRRLASRIGAAIKRQRKELRWSQATLAERIDASVNYVSLLERGERLPAVAMLVSVARVLGTDVGVLVGEPEAQWVRSATRMLESLRPAERNTVMAMLRGLVAETRRTKAKP